MRRGWKNLVVTIVVVAVAVAVWTAYWIGTREPRRSITCIGNLRALSAATFHWTLTREGRTPASLELLLGQPGITRKTFICPASGSTLEDDRFVCDYDSIFDRAGRPVSFQGLDDPSNTMMIWDREPVHGGGGAPYRHVLFADGNLRRVREAEFEAALKKLDSSASPGRK
ncbi:MAG: hypothetical protein ABIF82_04325 [Planctomycetota bacterium]